LPQYTTIAIIVAGGSGKRFGSSTPKQFLPLLGRPMLLHTLNAFQACQAVDAVCVVCPDGQEKTVEAWRQSEGLDKVQWVIAGGQERQDSTRCGLQAIPPCEYVLVHDGARPLVTPALIDAVVAGTVEKGAAVPGLVVSETLKKVGEGGAILTTVDRDEYATIQTPQGFRYTMLVEALQEAETDGFYGTDEAMLIERMGFPVSVVTGRRDNIKITDPADLEFAELILKERGES
jgi:2-C-methyl-D-erythritol 4-phosphate cytidylyltransferase